MAFILNVDTATEQGSVSLSLKNEVVAQQVSVMQKDHASWIHVAIDALFRESGSVPEKLDAIAVVAGPGSYTGVRVGMATAKGLTYALNKPLISLSTLQVMAHAAAGEIEKNVLLAPMLDARRMEVFAAVYNKMLEEIMAPSALVLDNSTFEIFLKNNSIVFFGSGSKKWRPLVNNSNALFADIVHQPKDIASLAYLQFSHRIFADIVYADPVYLKDFHYAHQKV